MTGPVLSVRDLTTVLHLSDGPAEVVRGVDFDVFAGETVALVGESGCGKSMTMLSVMGLHPQPPAEVVKGRVELEGSDLLEMPEERRRMIRGAELAMVYQDPMTSLNPLMRIGDQIGEVLVAHGRSRREARQRTLEVLEEVGIPLPQRAVDAYPHEFSGGMRQRAMLAVALASDPDLLIADEPTTALDTTTQAGILRQIRTLRDQRDLGVLLISHDIGVVAQTCDRVVVMYGGQVMEAGPVDDVLTMPEHPYTRALLECSPRNLACGDRVRTLAESQPDAIGGHDGCPFADCCHLETPDCHRGDIPITEREPDHRVACIEAPLERHRELTADSGSPNRVAPDGGADK